MAVFRSNLLLVIASVLAANNVDCIDVNIQGVGIMRGKENLSYLAKFSVNFFHYYLQQMNLGLHELGFVCFLISSVRELDLK